MKIFNLLVFILLASGLQAQVIEDSNPPVSTDQLEQKEKEIKQLKKELEEQSSKVESAQAAYKAAQEKYKAAQKELAQARQEEMKADNQLESARMSMRQAKLTLNRANKEANPIVIENYEPMINPIYEEMSKGLEPGLSVYIEGSETSGLFNVFSKNVDKEFKAYMKQFPSEKVKKRKGELFFDNIMISQISPSNMDLYVDFVEQDNGVSIRTYYNNGANFIDFNDDADAGTSYAKRLLDQFARYMRTKNLEEEIVSLEKELEQNYKSLEDNKKDISKAKEDIQNAKAAITEKRNEVASYENAIDDLNEKLELTRKKLSKVN